MIHRSTTIPTSHDGPRDSSDRVLSLDVLRGLALFGILLVNMKHFATPALYGGGTSAGTMPLDRVVDGLIFVFAQGKFFPLFSFLFGLGLALQLMRWQAKGLPSTHLFIRRLGVLLVIGLAHATLVWAGDILAKYAALGLLFLVLLPHGPRVLLAASGVFLLMPVFLSRTGLEGGLATWAGFPTTAEGLQTLVDQSIAAYGSGTFVEMTRQRLVDVTYRLVKWSYVTGLFTILGMFCLGAYAGRVGFFQNADSARFRKVLGWSFGIFAASLGAFALSRWVPVLGLPPVLSILNLAGNLALTAIYVSSVVLLLDRKYAQRLLSPFASAGRMALTNYLLQSMLATAVFYGTGLYATLGSTACLGITVAIFVVQVLVSGIWLRYFRFGPFEYLWRWATYGKRPELRRRPS